MLNGNKIIDSFDVVKSFKINEENGTNHNKHRSS